MKEFARNLRVSAQNWVAENFFRMARAAPDPAAADQATLSPFVWQKGKGQ